MVPRNPLAVKYSPALREPAYSECPWSQTKQVHSVRKHCGVYPRMGAASRTPARVHRHERTCTRMQAPTSQTNKQTHLPPSGWSTIITTSTGGHPSCRHALSTAPMRSSASARERAHASHVRSRMHARRTQPSGTGLAKQSLPTHRLVRVRSVERTRVAQRRTESGAGCGNADTMMIPRAL